MSEVIILLATHNGEKYLNVMIDSILSQDFREWRLILSDDASEDGTMDILRFYAEKYPEKITLYQSGQRFGNAKHHFMHLLEQFNEAEYLMFADQDDRWHANKVSATLRLMKQLEEKTNVPVMVHTDLCVVDENLQCLNPSFMKYSNLDGSRLGVNTLLIQNVVTGCTMMLNRALVKKVAGTMVKSDILMHDWWIALVASTCGVTGFLNEATMDYRQHGENSVGAKDSHSARYILNRSVSGENYIAIRNTFLQARALSEAFGKEMKPKDAALVAVYGEAADANFLKRRWMYIKYGIFKKGISRKIGQLIYG